MNAPRGQLRSGFTAVELLVALIIVAAVVVCFKTFPKSSVSAQNQVAPFAQVAEAAHAVKDTAGIASAVIRVAGAADADQPAVVAPAVDQSVVDPSAAVPPAVESARDDGWGDILDDIFDGL
jgi:prepilin-type N-terminal cleavage/methylation domain-containing protein